MKEDIEKFVEWMFQEKNKVFVKNASSHRIAQLFNNETGSSITHIFVNYHRLRWIMVDHKPYDVTKLPPFILYDESFKKYAKDNNMSIETLDWSINGRSEVDQKEIIVEKI